ncbi:response regulator transcription factor [Pseudothauera lacus]|uniref:DNA-binding response regulator n=1 Tax=Pseudothauera lacus TaxID=2136175 RepID=A0A2T4IJU8_9RHOO|nr:response regulator transcription factor [Pseudothauera lacus]PTD98049.1 DNA-binding response regulator [Pseudothauera lacus]
MKGEERVPQAVPQACILIVEDDTALYEVMREYLALAGYRVRGAVNGGEFRAAIAESSFDLILLDLNLPDCDGLDLLAALRQRADTLLFVVSGREDGFSRERSLEIGADDYIAKPFSARELELRIRNALRRRRPQVEYLGAGALPAFCGWRIDEALRAVVHADGHRIQLTRAEYELLHMLASARAGVVSRDRLLDRLAEVARVSNPETVTALVYRLRRKLAQHGQPDPIVTLSGVGYRLQCCSAGDLWAVADAANLK